jgi:hypothetical protein
MEFEQKTFDNKLNRIKLEAMVYQWCAVAKVRKWMKCSPDSADYMQKTAELEH